MKVYKKFEVPTISAQFTALLSIFTLIPTIFICVLTYRMNDVQLTSTSLRLAEKAIIQTANSIGEIMQSAENTAAVLSKDTTLQTAHNDFINELPLSTAIDHYIRLNRLFAYLNLNSNFYSIRVYLPDYYRITCEEYSIFGISKLDSSKLPSVMQMGKRGYGWFGPYELTRISKTETVFSYYHTLFSYQQYSKNNSVICIDISAKMLSEKLMQDNGIEAIYILTDSDGKIVLASERDEDFFSAIYHEISSIERNGKEGSFILLPGKGDCFYKRITVGNSGWHVSGFVPIGQFRKENRIALYIIGVFIFCLWVIPFVSYKIVRTLVKGIMALTVSCNRVRNGIYETIPVDGTTKEIRLLQDTHNSMIKKIDILIHDVYEASLAKQEAEMEFLYEQIKPHFLYNTLESAKWMALKENAVNVAKFIENLSKYFRLTLNKGHDWIPLKQEMEQVDAYIRIMNARFANRIHHHIIIDEDIKDIPVLKLILQPIVENAIIHGIHVKEEFNGTINISASRLDQNIVMTIEDDGAGMDDDTLHKLNEGYTVGFGIANVRKRLELFYGQECSIRFYRNDKMGTTVMIIIPILSRDKLIS